MTINLSFAWPAFVEIAQIQSHTTQFTAQYQAVFHRAKKGKASTFLFPSATTGGAVIDRLRFRRGKRSSCVGENTCDPATSLDMRCSPEGFCPALQSKKSIQQGAPMPRVRWAGAACQTQTNQTFLGHKLPTQPLASSPVWGSRNDRYAKEKCLSHFQTKPPTRQYPETKPLDLVKGEHRQSPI